MQLRVSVVEHILIQHPKGLIPRHMPLIAHEEFLGERETKAKKRKKVKRKGTKLEQGLA